MRVIHDYSNLPKNERPRQTVTEYVVEYRTSWGDWEEDGRYESYEEAKESADYYLDKANYRIKAYEVEYIISYEAYNVK